MKRALITLFLLTGCAHGLEKTVDGVEKTAAGVKVVATESANLWDAGVEAQVAYCKAKGLDESATEEARAKCMGILGKGDKAEPALDKIRDGYDLIADGLKLLKEGSGELQPYLEAAEQAVKRGGK